MALLVFPSIPTALAVLIGASLAPTDAALSASVVGDASVGVGAGVAAADGFVVVGVEVGFVVRPELRRRGCAMALTAIVMIRTKIQREVRFMQCIFLTVRGIVNSGDA